MEAVIMAGGEGIRLRPMTCALPKPMVTLLGKPIMEYDVNWLSRHDVKKVTVALQYMPDHIMTYFGDGSDWDMDMSYRVEKIPLGTAGSVRNAMIGTQDTIVVISGDALTDIDLSAAYAFHQAKQAQVTIIVKQVNNPTDYGVVLTGDDGRITGFQEKPTWSEVNSDLVNTGIYILQPEILSYIPEDRKFDFAKDLFPILLEKKVPVFGFETSNYWCDIGTPDQYRQAQMDLMEGRVDIGTPVEPIWVAQDVSIPKDTQLIAPCFIDSGCIIGEGVTLGPGCVLEQGVTVGEDSSIKYSVIWRDSVVGDHNHLRGAILGTHVTLSHRVNVLEGAILGGGCDVAERVTIENGVRIWPQKQLDSGVTATADIIWGDYKAHSLFGSEGISGSLSNSLTPEKICTIGRIWASNTKNGAKLAVGMWGSSSLFTAKYSLLAGVASGGRNHYDFGQLPPFMLRYAIRKMGLDGGVMLMGRGETVTLSLYNDDGCEIDHVMKKNMESMYLKGASTVLPASKQGHTIVIDDIDELYVVDMDMPDKRHRLRINLYSTEPRLIHYIADLYTRGGYRVQCLPPEELYHSRVNCIDVVFSHGGEDMEIYLDGENIIGSNNLPEIQAVMFMGEVAEQPEREVPLLTVFPSAVRKYADDHHLKYKESGIHHADWMREIGVYLHEWAGGLTIMDRMDNVGFVLELLNRSDFDLDALRQYVKTVPSGSIVEGEVACPWELRGSVVREFTKRYPDNQQGDGVKIAHNQQDWVLVTPDNRSSDFRIFAETAREEYAQELVADYSRQLRDIIDSLSKKAK